MRGVLKIAFWIKYEYNASNALQSNFRFDWNFRSWSLIEIWEWAACVVRKTTRMNMFSLFSVRELIKINEEKEKQQKLLLFPVQCFPAVYSAVFETWWRWEYMIEEKLDERHERWNVWCVCVAAIAAVYFNFKTITKNRHAEHFGCLSRCTSVVLPSLLRTACIPLDSSSTKSKGDTQTCFGFLVRLRYCRVSHSSINHSHSTPFEQMANGERHSSRRTIAFWLCCNDQHNWHLVTYKSWRIFWFLISFLVFINSSLFRF